MSRSESLINIAVRAVTIAALGGMIGLVDSSIRPVKTKLDAPPPLDAPSGGGVSAPRPVSADTPQGQPPSAPQANPATPAATAPEPLPEGHITIAQGKALFDKKEQFVDARKPEDYEAGHVPGAIRMALGDFKDAIPAPIEFMDKSKPVVVYCAGGHCDESEAVGKQLNLLGFANVYILHDGFPGWKDAGHAVETGPGQWP